MASATNLRPVRADDPDAIALSAALDAEVAARYADVPDFPVPTRLESGAAAEDVMLAVYEQDRPLGLGGLRRLDRKTAEVKHLYVVPSARGRGLGRMLLTALEARARELGYESLSLDTGSRQGEAIGLYLSFGYSDVPAYNTNPGAERWFEKRVGPAE